MHRSDGELQALIDGQLDRDASERALSHLADCERCRTRRDALEMARRETADQLRLLDREAPALSADDVIRTAERRAIARRTAPRNVFWAAAIAGLLAAGVVAAAVIPGSPVRAVIERMMAGEEAGAPAQEPIPAESRERSAGVALVPDGELEIAFETLQSEGTIELVEVGSDTARVDARGDSVGFVVGGGSVRVENRGAKASYRVLLPMQLPAVVIRVGDRTVYRRVGAEVLLDEFRSERNGRRIDLPRIRPED